MTLIPDWNISNPVTYARMRQTMLDGALQEGVVGATDLKVVQRGAGANQSVDVGAGFAWVQIDTGTRNGLGHVTNDATANVTVTASDATNPRIDQIILRWNDTSIPTGSGNVPTLAVLTGTATAGATLDNRTGAAALPNDCLRLADILVPATSTSVTTANIRDRRPWSRGANFTVTGSNAGNFTTTSTAAVQFASGAFDARIECSGTQLDIDFSALVQHSAAGGTVSMALQQDGGTIRLFNMASATVNQQLTLTGVATLAPTAGSHVFTWQWFIATAGTAAITNAGSIVPTARYRERVASNTSNT